MLRGYYEMMFEAVYACSGFPCSRTVLDKMLQTYLQNNPVSSTRNNWEVTSLVKEDFGICMIFFIKMSFIHYSSSSLFSPAKMN